MVERSLALERQGRQFLLFLYHACYWTIQAGVFFLFSSSGKGWGFVPVHYLDTRSDQASAHVTTRSSRSSYVLFLLSFQSNSAPNQITLPLTLPLLLHALPQPTSSLKRDIELIDQRNPRGPPRIPLSIRQTRDVRIPDNVHRVVEAVGWPGGRPVGFLSGPVVGRAGEPSRHRRPHTGWLCGAC